MILKEVFMTEKLGIWSLGKRLMDLTYVFLIVIKKKFEKFNSIYLKKTKIVSILFKNLSSSSYQIK